MVAVVEAEVRVDAVHLEGLVRYRFVRTVVIVHVSIRLPLFVAVSFSPGAVENSQALSRVSAAFSVGIIARIGGAT